MPRAVPAAAPPMTSFADGIRAASSPPGWTEPVRSHSVDLEELPGWARALLDSERVGHLAFLDEADLPRVLAVTFAVWEGAVWSAIDRKPKRVPEPARVRRLRRRPEAAFLVDRYDDDWTRLAWGELRGRGAIEPRRPAFGAPARKDPPYGLRAPQGPPPPPGAPRLRFLRA